MEEEAWSKDAARWTGTRWRPAASDRLATDGEVVIDAPGEFSLNPDFIHLNRLGEFSRNAP